MIVFHLHVCRRVPELAPHAIAADDSPADAVWPAQQPGGTRKVACGKRVPHRGTRNTLAVSDEAGHCIHGVTQSLRMLAKHVQIACSARAETEIVTYEHDAHAPFPSRLLITIK